VGSTTSRRLLTLAHATAKTPLTHRVRGLLLCAFAYERETDLPLGATLCVASAVTASSSRSL
jgi:hypothetical protein